MKKIPDNFVPNKKEKTFPTEIGSQNFSPENISLFKLEKTQKVKKYFSSKFDEIANQYQLLLEEISLNERIYKSKMNFDPIPGSDYFLYKKKNGEEFISLIGPTEWINNFEYIGKYQLLTDGRWIEITK